MTATSNRRRPYLTWAGYVGAIERVSCDITVGDQPKHPEGEKKRYHNGLHNLLNENL